MKIEEYPKYFLKFNEADDIKEFKSHADCTCLLSELLFNKMSEFCFFEKKQEKQLREKLKLLLISSKLHDIGIFIQSDKPHNKSGAKFILENGIEGLTKEELQTVANIVRFHRGKLPKNQKIYRKLNEEDKTLVNIFASILRIADVLDYNHLSVCKSFELLNPKEDMYRLICPSDLFLNQGFIKSFRKKKKMFEKNFNCKLSIQTEIK